MVAAVIPQELTRGRLLSYGRKRATRGIVLRAEEILSQGRKDYCLTGGRNIVAGAEARRGLKSLPNRLLAPGEYLSV
jgi:hypothetical protein